MMNATQNSSHMPVPKGEFELALECIDKLISSKINYDREVNGAEQRCVPLETSIDILQESILSSMHSEINGTVLPIHETDYKQQFVKFDTPMKREIQVEPGNLDDYLTSKDDANSESESFASSSDSSDDDDEDDVIDFAALDRARKLREEVRNKASELNAIKNSKMAILLENFMNELNKWNKIEINQSNEQHNRSGDDIDAKVSEHKIEKMRKSLDHLQRTLKTVGSDLPNELESLQQTAETILHYFERNEKGREVVHRVERAILSRVDVNVGKSEEKNAFELTPSRNTKQMDAEQRFALFVSQTD